MAVCAAVLTEDIGVNADLIRRQLRGTSARAVTVTHAPIAIAEASHSVEYPKVRVAGFGRTDMLTTAALVYSLQRHTRVPPNVATGSIVPH